MHRDVNVEGSQSDKYLALTTGQGLVTLTPRYSDNYSTSTAVP